MSTAQPLMSEGSVPWKVIQFLDSNPDEQLDAEIIAVKYGCPRSKVHTLLGEAVQSGSLARSTDVETGEVVYSKAAKAMSIVERCIQAYRSSPNLDHACQVARVHKLTMFKILKIHGVMLASDRLTLGSMGSRMGASAEQEFQRLVPFAKPMNDLVSSNPGFDFDVNGWRVDVKAYSPAQIKGRKSAALTWQIKIAKSDSSFPHVDMFCIFLAAQAGKLIQDCPHKTYLVPAELVSGRSYVHKTEGRPSVLDGLEVQPEQLAGFFVESGAA